jgi:serine/threonine-protein kinase
MAVVHRAVFRPTGEEVALKLILGNNESDPTFMERFRREVKATIGLSHPNICRVIGAGEDAGRLFMAMEIIDGGSVRELKQKFGGRMPLQLAVELTAQLLAALGEAHTHGVIHRDLKPANLMLTTSGLLKLVDFGIAKSSSDATLTATGMLVGTPAFMSPEQVRGGPAPDGLKEPVSGGSADRKAEQRSSFCRGCCEAFP